MEENLKNKIGFWTFTFIVLFLLIGGYFFTKYTLNNDNKSEYDKNKTVSYKIEKNKEYIYFTDEQVVSDGAGITHQDVIINLNTQTNITEALKKENENFKENIKYIKNENIIAEDLIKYNNDDIYSRAFRKYQTYTYNNYVSLLINYFNYTCFDGTTYSKSKSYVFDTSNGKSLTDAEILRLYDSSENDLKERIRASLTNEQTIKEDGVELIKIEETINNLSNYGLYINEFGRLYVSFLVKTTEVDYNKIMEVK